MGTPARYIECMEWFSWPPYSASGAPGAGRYPSKAPDSSKPSIVGYARAAEGCAPDRTLLAAVLSAQRAAGIMFVAG
jgi:hypothetical protein